MEYEVIVGVLLKVLEHFAPENLLSRQSVVAMISLPGTQVLPKEFIEDRIVIDDPADLLEELSSGII